MKCARNVIELPKNREERRKDELAFLPAALEIVETPLSPTGRAIAFTIMAVFALALIWACIGTVDIVPERPNPGDGVTARVYDYGGFSHEISG